MTAIEIQGVSKTFGPRRAVVDLSLSVPKGSIYALLGDNGAGKTTTIRMLAGLERADSGSLKVLNRECWAQAVALRHLVGYVPERPRFYDWMTVREIGWFTSGFHRKGYLDRYQAMVDQFGLDAYNRLRNLSKGQYAKVGLSLALAADPEVLILDEPTSGLDLLVRREFLTSMVDMASEGRTILISSHQISEVERIASHVAFMAHGRLLLHGSLEEVRRRLVRVSLRHEGELPGDLEQFGRVLTTEELGKQWQMTLLDPHRDALEQLRQRPDICDFEETPIDLEEAYCALLGEKEVKR